MRSFINQFTLQDVVPDDKVRRIGNDFFLVDTKLAEVLKKIRLPPLHTGLYLGRFTGKTNIPSLDLLQMLAKTDAKKAWLNNKSAWLFVCKRPALASSILKNQASPNEVVLVMNEYNECIGYGLFDGKNIKNYFDIGDFLRRERRAKRF